MYAGVKPGFLIIDDGWQQVAPDPKYRSTLLPDQTDGVASVRVPSPDVTSVRPVETEELQEFSDLIEEAFQELERSFEEGLVNIRESEKRLEDRLAKELDDRMEDLKDLERRIEKRCAFVALFMRSSRAPESAPLA